MYCESFAAINSSVTDSFATAHATVIDFWARVTPGILQLLSHSKVVRDAPTRAHPVAGGGEFRMKDEDCVDVRTEEFGSCRIYWESCCFGSIIVQLTALELI